MTKFNTDFKTNHHMNRNLTSLLVDYYPISKKTFHATAGLIFNQMHYIFNAKFSRGDTIGALIITPEMLGEFNLDFFYPLLAPYIGIGFGRLVSLEKLSAYMDMGVIYMGKPKVDFTAKGLIAPMADQDAIVANNISGYRYYPVFSFGIAYKIL